jgi:hypothetical protein
MVVKIPTISPEAIPLIDHSRLELQCVISSNENNLAAVAVTGPNIKDQKAKKISDILYLIDRDR